MSASSGKRLEARFSGGECRPGEAVTGVIVAREKFKARELQASLCYIEESSDYVEQAEVEAPLVLKSGALAPGEEVPFTFRLPAEALPNWVPTDPDLASCAKLYWAVVVKGTRWGPLPDRVERLAVPVATDPEAFTGPAPDGAGGEVTGSPKDWDVSLAVDRWSVHRGDEVKATVTVGDAAPGRDGIDVGLVCTVHYDVEETVYTGNSTSTARETRKKTLHEERIRIDPYSPVQEVRLRVPADGPFTYGEREATKLGPFTFGGGSTGKGAAVVIEWKVVVREDRRLRRDPNREVEIEVRP